MIRRSERLVKQETGGAVTWYRVTRLHVFGFCVWTNQVEVPSVPPLGAPYPVPSAPASASPP